MIRIRRYEPSKASYRVIIWVRVNMKADPSKLSCLRCGEPMQFARSVSRPIGLPKVQKFECRHCGIAVPAEAAVEVLKIAMQLRPA